MPIFTTPRIKWTMKFDLKNYRVMKADHLANEEVDQGLWVSEISAFGERVRLGLYD